MIKIDNNKVIHSYNGEKLQIETWGNNSFRVRITRLPDFTNEDWALLPQEKILPEISISSSNVTDEGVKANSVENINGDSATIKNGKISATITKEGKLIFCNSDGDIILAEYEYERNTCLCIKPHELKSIAGGLFKASIKFASNPNERLYGMGQYQNGIFDLKGSFLELAQRNSQASVPFVYSNLGYGFFWNNPAIGRATFGKNITEWEASVTKQIDFWITVGDTPSEILSNYMDVTGKPPMMPDYGLGYWQCKLRYRSQEEVLEVAREHKRRGVKLDVIVIDFFHWPIEGSWEFDSEYWPDPAAMVKELNDMGIKVMISVWPTIALRAPLFKEFEEKGFLVQSNYGIKSQKKMIEPTSFVDFTNPSAREQIWDIIKKNYVSFGINDFWLDVAEPEYSNYDFENHRYYKGSVLEVGNEYPVLYTKTFYDGLLSENKESVNLVRCAWAGSQRYGALVWSGDIESSFESLKKQVICGLQMAMSGIPWWTTDIGGFNGGNVDDPKFHELLIRWFQYACFCPVMRMHGNRKPIKGALGTSGGGLMGSGADNEIWSYGEDNYLIMKHYIELRYKLKPYLKELMKKSSETGCPVIRPLFYNFPNDNIIWDIDDQFMLGEYILVAPILEYGQRTRKVYLPSGCNWILAGTDLCFDGGQWIEVDAPIEKIPVFIKDSNKTLNKCFKL